MPPKKKQDAPLPERKKKVRAAAIPARREWSAEHLIPVYELARSGRSNAQIFTAMGIPPATFKRWLVAHPELQNAIFKGRAVFDKKGSGSSGLKKFHDYLFDQLPPNLRGIWAELEVCFDPEVNDVVRMEALLAKCGERAKQQLWIHAFTISNFKKSAACKIVQIAPQTLDRWIEEDPDFAGLFQHVVKCKIDFFEDAFLDLVADRNPAATIHAAKTQLADRGYGDRAQQVNHAHEHIIVPIDSLGLSLEERKNIRERIRGTPRLPAPDDDAAIDVTFEELAEDAK